MKVSCWNGFFCIIVINGHSDGDLNVVIELSSKSAGECTLGGSSNSKETFCDTPHFVSQPKGCQVLSSPLRLTIF